MECLPCPWKCLREPSLPLCTTPTLTSHKGNQPAKKKKKKNIEKMSKDYYTHGSQDALWNSTLSLSSSPFLPTDSSVLSVPEDLGLLHSYGLKLWLPSVQIFFPAEPLYSKSQTYAPQSNDFNYLSQQNPLKIYRPCPQKNTHRCI